jgi:hypothetical protein
VSTRLDSVLQKHPDHEEGIRLLAERDPSGNLKYLAWGAKMLAAGQALAPEIADVLDLFHRFAGQRLERTGAQVRRRDRRMYQNGDGNRVHPDVNTYRPQDFAKLRDLLNKLKRAQDKKRKEREKLYRIEGSVEADVVYDSDDLIVRHIKNKNASIHYGHETKWCISMTQEGYFEDYETHNATFFFFERKKPQDDEFDKTCLMLSRSGARESRHFDEGASVFNALDQRVDMFALAKVHGSRIFDIFRQCYEASEKYPGSVLFNVFAGIATREQLETVFNSVTVDLSQTDALLESIVCNDAASPEMLEYILRSAVALSAAAWKAAKRRGRIWRRGRRMSQASHDAELTRTIMSALVIHPNTPGELRERVVKDLRRRHVTISEIRRTTDDGRVGVAYRNRNAVKGLRRRRFRRMHVKYLPVSALNSRIRRLEKQIVQTKKWLEKRVEADKKKAAKRAAAKQKKKR